MESPGWFQQRCILRSSKRRLCCEPRRTRAARRRSWNSSRAPRGERFLRDLGSGRRMLERRSGKNRKRSNANRWISDGNFTKEKETHGSDVVVGEAGGLRGGNFASAGHAAGVLAGVHEVALEILAGSDCSAAAGAAADGAGILRAGGDGIAWAAWAALDGAVWPQPGVYVQRAGAGVGVVQLAVCGAAADCLV